MFSFRTAGLSVCRARPSALVCSRARVCCTPLHQTNCERSACRTRSSRPLSRHRHVCCQYMCSRPDDAPTRAPAPAPPRPDALRRQPAARTRSPLRSCCLGLACLRFRSHFYGDCGFKHHNLGAFSSFRLLAKARYIPQRLPRARMAAWRKRLTHQQRRALNILFGPSQIVRSAS